MLKATNVIRNEIGELTKKLVKITDPKSIEYGVIHNSIAVLRDIVNGRLTNEILVKQKILRLQEYQRLMAKEIKDSGIKVDMDNHPIAVPIAMIKQLEWALKGRKGGAEQ